LTRESQEAVIKRGNLILDVRCHTVLLNGKNINLHPKEFDLLYLLARHPNWIFSKEEIYENVYKDEMQINIDNTIFCLIYGLRKKMETDLKHPKYIKTVRGVGYKFIENS